MLKSKQMIQSIADSFMDDTRHSRIHQQIQLTSIADWEFDDVIFGY